MRRNTDQLVLKYLQRRSTGATTEDIGNFLEHKSRGHTLNLLRVMRLRGQIKTRDGKEPRPGVATQWVAA